MFSPQGVLRGEDLALEAVEALLVLIPKEEKPSSIRRFGSISLYNINVKLVTKMIVNRLKMVLDGTVAPNQASVIPGKQSIDNIMICQEVIHTLRCTKAKRDGIVLKLDLEKSGRNGVLLKKH